MTPGVAGMSRVADSGTCLSSREYQLFLDRFNYRFQEQVGSSANPLFHTNVGDLWPVYLEALPESARQHHTCNECRRFIQRFGGLATIDTQGVIKSALWTDVAAPALYAPGIQAMKALVENAEIRGVFVSEARTIGQPRTGEWSHLSVILPLFLINTSRSLRASQVMAERLEDFKNMKRALTEFSQQIVAQAVTILEADALYRSEKVLGPAKWLHALQESLSGRTPHAVDNLLWKAIATAPAGFAHPRSSMIGTLLEDLVEGLPLRDVSRKFKAKMDPLQYQRPQAAPSVGNILSAEKLVAKMGIELSLIRRFAKPEEVRTIWNVRDSGAVRINTAGVFAGITPKVKAPASKDLLDLPSQNMTWTRFVETVLSEGNVTNLEVYLGNQNHALTAFVTAMYPEAPPILQWDRLDRRNPVSWYLWASGSLPSHWGLRANQFHKVWGVSEKPSHWFDNKCENQEPAAVLLIEGIRETRNSGSALFPEILSSEMRPVRSTIEAYSKANNLLGMGEPQAAGLMVIKGSQMLVQARVRVTTTKNTRAEYIIDRWI